jgi:glycosyltransferase involved in cell wall biosynthesis
MVFGHKARRSVENGARVIRYRNFARALSQPLSIGWVIRAAVILSRRDPVILHTPNILGSLIAVIARRAPLIVFWHSDLADRGRYGRFLVPLEHMMLARAKRVWVTSAEYATGSPALRQWQDKVYVLVPGVPDPKEIPCVGYHNDLKRLLAGRRVVLAVGRLVKYKNFERLIEAAKLLPPDHVVVIVGDGPERGALDRKVSEAGLSKMVVLTGGLSDEALSSIYAIARVLAVTSLSRSETFGMVQVEALAYGVPIVVTDIKGSGVASVSGYGSVGVVVPNDSVQALAKAITCVTLDADWTALSSRARSRYDELFTERRMVRDACIQLEEVIKAPSPLTSRR